MICRRGGIDKHDIGAIRILDTTTEFEISKTAAESFAAKIRRPDKEDNIRIEPLAGAPQDQAPSDRGARHHEKPRDERAPKPHGKPYEEGRPRVAKVPDYAKKKQRHRDKPAYAAKPQFAGGPTAKPAFGKKPKKNRQG
jgi:ATP-dependent RNA helicase DeaD